MMSMAQITITAERGETIEYKFTTKDEDDNFMTPTTMYANITSKETRSIMATTPTILTTSLGNYKLKIPTADLVKGTYYVIVDAVKGNYTQKQYITLNITDHEGVM